MTTIPDENEESQEYEYEKMSSVRRYYCDILSKGVSPVDMVISFEKLLQSEGVIGDETSLDAITAHIFSIQGTITTKRLMREVYCMLPFEFMAPYVDLMFNVKKQESWYDDAVNHTKSWIRTSHTRACIENSQVESDACGKSETCPLIVLKQLLIKDVFEYDFDDASYVLNPTEAYDVASVKLRLAIKYDFTDRELALFKHQMYDIAFCARFPENTKAATPQQQGE